MAAAEAVRGLPRGLRRADERGAVAAVVEPVLLLPAREAGRALGDLVERPAGNVGGTSSPTSVNSTPSRAAAEPSAMHQGHSGAVELVVGRRTPARRRRGRRGGRRRCSGRARARSSPSCADRGGTGSRGTAARARAARRLVLSSASGATGPSLNRAMSGRVRRDAPCGRLDGGCGVAAQRVVRSRARSPCGRGSRARGRGRAGCPAGPGSGARAARRRRPARRGRSPSPSPRPVRRGSAARSTPSSSAGARSAPRPSRRGCGGPRRSAARTRRRRDSCPRAARRRPPRRAPARPACA